MTLNEKLSAIRAGLAFGGPPGEQETDYTITIEMLASSWTLIIKDGDGNNVVEMRDHPSIESAVDRAVTVIAEKLFKDITTALVVLNKMRSVASPLTGQFALTVKDGPA